MATPYPQRCDGPTRAPCHYGTKFSVSPPLTSKSAHYGSCASCARRAKVLLLHVQGVSGDEPLRILAYWACVFSRCRIPTKPSYSRKTNTSGVVRTFALGFQFMNAVEKWNLHISPRLKQLVGWGSVPTQGCAQRSPGARSLQWDAEHAAPTYSNSKSLLDSPGPA